MPTAIGTAMDVNLSNASLVFISVTFAMCKSAAPIFLLLFAFAFSIDDVEIDPVSKIQSSLNSSLGKATETNNIHEGLFHNFRKEVNDGLRIGLEMRIAQLESEKSSLLQKEVRLVEETKRDDEADIKREAGSQEGTQQVAGTNENAADGSNPQTKKLIISDEYFQRVTRALIMHLRQHEETVLQQGSGKGTVYLSIKNWVGWNKATRFDSMVDQQNEKNAYSSMEEVKAEHSRLKAIIESLIQRKGYLIVLDDGMHEAAEGAAPEHVSRNDRILAVAPNYYID
ncbi:hypothetical protein HN51_004808 [Arachis hypogaea]